MGHKWLQERNGITRSSFQRPNLGNQGQINFTACEMQKYFPGKMHLVIRPVETLPIQISMSAVGKLRISMCCTLMCFLPCCSEAYNILGIVGIE